MVIIDGASMQLFAGEMEFETIPATIVAGSGILKVGTVVGRITDGGKYAPYNDLHVDGTEVARAILTEDLDATNADVNTSIFVEGTINRAALTGIDQAGEYDLQDRGIFVKGIY